MMREVDERQQRKRMLEILIPQIGIWDIEVMNLNYLKIIIAVFNRL